MYRIALGFIFLYIYSCATQDKASISSSDSHSLGSDSTFYQSYWAGDLRYQTYHLPLAFQIKEDKITFDNPAQGGSNVAVDSFTYNDSSLDIYLSQLKFTLTPENTDQIDATLYEGDDARSFILYRDKELSKPDRPQHPEVSTKYQSEEIKFQNKEADILLAGTFTSPFDQPKSLIILLTGSGPQDRDETIVGHRPFALLADVLTKRGMGVLRYDDRGMGSSEGAHPSATSFNFAQDASAAFDYLKSRYPETPIGFLGHSEGGMIAQIVDSLVGGADFHIYLAGPGIEIIELMTKQNELVYKNMLSEEALEKYIAGLRPIFELITSNEELAVRQNKVNEKAKELYNSLPTEDAKKIAPSDLLYAISISQLMYLKWWPYFLGYQPSQYLAQIKCPILALNGEKDIQVTPDNLQAIKKYASQSEVAIFTLEDTNHLFQRCNSCTLREYGLLTETFSPYALDAIVTWLMANEFIEDL